MLDLAEAIFVVVGVGTVVAGLMTAHAVFEYFAKRSADAKLAEFQAQATVTADMFPLQAAMSLRVAGMLQGDLSSQLLARIYQVRCKNIDFGSPLATFTVKVSDLEQQTEALLFATKVERWAMLRLLDQHDIHVEFHAGYPAIPPVFVNVANDSDDIPVNAIRYREPEFSERDTALPGILRRLQQQLS